MVVARSDDPPILDRRGRGSDILPLPSDGRYTVYNKGAVPKL